eukprot:COSAG01_NODE_1617_length_9718_cov_267.124545_4_plen_208_part_00
MLLLFLLLLLLLPWRWQHLVPATMATMVRMAVTMVVTMMVRTMGRNDAGGGSGGGGGGGMGAATPIAAPGLVKMVMFLRALYLHTCTRTKLAHTTDAGAGRARTQRQGARTENTTGLGTTPTRGMPRTCCSTLQQNAYARTHAHDQQGTARGGGRAHARTSRPSGPNTVALCIIMLWHGIAVREGAERRQAGRQAACGHGLASGWIN